jgi:galactitol-specific phosphotransferase system IIC component
MNKTGQTIIVVAVIVVAAFIIHKIVEIENRIPEVPKKVEIDAEKVGKKLGDLKRDFLKGYNDTTSIEKDSIK